MVHVSLLQGRYSVVDLDVNLGDVSRPRIQQTFQVDLKEYLPMIAESKAKVNGKSPAEFDQQHKRNNTVCDFMVVYQKR